MLEESVILGLISSAGFHSDIDKIDRIYIMNDKTGFISIFPTENRTRIW